MTRQSAVQDFIDASARALRARLAPDSEAARVADRIFARLEAPGNPVMGQLAGRLPVCDHLDPALRTASAGEADIAAVTAAFRAIEPQLAWGRRAGAEKAGPVFANGHANATIIGSSDWRPGLEERGDVQIGVSLMAPEIQYIDHQHPPAEVYLVLSPGEWRQQDRLWHEPGIGGTVFNTPHIVHAMKSGRAPLFALWYLLVEPV